MSVRLFKTIYCCYKISTSFSNPNSTFPSFLELPFWAAFSISLMAFLQMKHVWSILYFGISGITEGHSSNSNLSISDVSRIQAFLDNLEDCLDFPITPPLLKSCLVGYTWICSAPICSIIIENSVVYLAPSSYLSTHGHHHLELTTSQWYETCTLCSN